MQKQLSSFQSRILDQRRRGQRLRKYISTARTAARPFTIPPDIHFLVVSPGGVATTTLMQHLDLYVRINDPFDSDGLKHRPRPPTSLLSHQRVLFISGPIHQSYLSLRRRHWVGIQSAKLGSLIGAISFPPLEYPLFALAARQQLQAWMAFAETHPDRVLHLDYKAIWPNRQVIMTFANISDPSFLTNFPTYRPRQSR